MIRPWSVYRLYATDGSLLYVGSTNNFARRVGEHRRKKAWGDQIATWTEDWPHTQPMAYRIEYDAILAEKPRYNQRRAPASVETVSLREMEQVMALLTMPTLESIEAAESLAASSP